MQRQRRHHQLRNIWRLLVLTALSAGLGYALLRWGWLLNGPEQVEVVGSRQVSREQVIAAADLSFPTPLLGLQPRRIAAELAAALPVEQVQVNRLMAPPRLRVALVDRPQPAQPVRAVPVAQAATAETAAPPVMSVRPVAMLAMAATPVPVVMAARRPPASTAMAGMRDRLATAVTAEMERLATTVPMAPTPATRERPEPTVAPVARVEPVVRALPVAQVLRQVLTPRAVTVADKPTPECSTM